jgi:hypothetical protein
VLTLTLALSAAAGLSPAPLSQCAFHEANKLVHRWEGGCGHLFGQEPKMKLRPAKEIESGRWRSDSVPTSVWAGSMTDQGFDGADLELELYGTHGILRTAYGWYAVRSFSVDRSAMRFELDTSREIAPSPLDIEIIRRADALLSSPACLESRRQPTVSGTRHRVEHLLCAGPRGGRRDVRNASSSAGDGGSSRDHRRTNSVARVRASSHGLQ